jgi:hypothetical protein
MLLLGTGLAVRYMSQRRAAALNGSHPRSRSCIAHSGTRRIWRTKSITGCKPSGKGAAWRIAGPIAYGTHSACASCWAGFSLTMFRAFLDIPA